MQHKEVQKLTPKITVVGVGGAGGNAVNNMISSGLQGVEFVVCNTDAQALEGSLCETKIQLGVTVTGGLGAGAKPEVGRSAAEESLDDVVQHLEGANMVFITAGMGGGTGTGAAPVIARACREKGILTVGVVTKPFHFEGTTRMKMAEHGIGEMQDYVDTLIVIPNQNLFRVANEKTTFAEAFKMADSVLQSGVRGVTDLMVMPGLINLDFADIRSAMLEMGKAMMGTGEAGGERRAVEAAEKAINNPLLDDVTMKGARGVIINVTGGYDMTLFEVDEACNRIRDEVDANANIIFGSTFEEGMEGIMRVSVVATGIDVVEERGRKGVPGLSLNAIMQQQEGRKLDRARPHTEQAVQHQTMTHVASAPVQPAIPAPQIPMGIRPAVSVPVPATAAATVARRIDDPEKEMFEQQEFAQEAQYVAQPQAAVMQQPQQQQAAALRGTVYNDSFIPPKPAEVDRSQLPSANYGPALGVPLMARRPVEAPVQTTTSSGGLNLRPPVPGAGATAQQRKRTPSLFERITGPLRHHAYEETDQGDAQQQGSAGGGAGGGASSGGFHARMQAQQQRAPLQQGSLNIDPPKTDNPDGELDIPAFLRRQAN